MTYLFCRIYSAITSGQHTVHQSNWENKILRPPLWGPNPPQLFYVKDLVMFWYGPVTIIKSEVRYIVPENNLMPLKYINNNNYNIWKKRNSQSFLYLKYLLKKLNQINEVTIKVKPKKAIFLKSLFFVFKSLFSLCLTLFCLVFSSLFAIYGSFFVIFVILFGLFCNHFFLFDFNFVCFFCQFCYVFVIFLIKVKSAYPCISKWDLK